MNLHLGTRDVEVPRAKLRQWFVLEEQYDSIREAAAKGETNGVADKIYSYVSAASGIDISDLEHCDWREVVVALHSIDANNAPKLEFPILYSVSSKKQSTPAAWDYVGRSWYVWVNILARAYGWGVEYIADLEIEDGIGLLQEILTDEQLEKEWQHGLSELSYEYSPTTKRSIYKPLLRPGWMQVRAPQETKKIKIREDMLPVGNVIDLGRSFMNGTKEGT